MHTGPSSCLVVCGIYSMISIHFLVGQSSEIVTVVLSIEWAFLKAKRSNHVLPSCQHSPSAWMASGPCGTSVGALPDGSLQDSFFHHLQKGSDLCADEMQYTRYVLSNS